MLNTLHRIKVITPKIHINHKVEKGKFTLDMSDTHHLNPVVKLNII